MRTWGAAVLRLALFGLLLAAVGTGAVPASAAPDLAATSPPPPPPPPPPAPGETPSPSPVPAAPRPSGGGVSPGLPPPPPAPPPRTAAPRVIRPVSGPVPAAPPPPPEPLDRPGAALLLLPTPPLPPRVPSPLPPPVVLGGYRVEKRKELGPMIQGGEPDSALGPAPDVRQRPEEPPPPGYAIPEWDLDWRNRAAGIGPPLPPPDPFAIRPIRFRPDTQIVSLDARRKAMKRVPQWVDVIERRDLAEWRPLDIGDLMRMLPNVMIADGGNPSLQMPWIRGLGRERVKILTDGVWPGSQALGYHGGTVSLWDPESTERVEVYHGPGAYLKGIDSPGGMINIVPRRPRRHDALSADPGFTSSYLSSSNKWRSRAEVDVGQERVAALVGVTWTTVGDRDKGGGGGRLDPSSYEQLMGDLAWDYFLDNRSRIGITAQYASNYNIRSPTGTGTDLQDPSFDRLYLALTLTSVDVGTVFSGTRVSIALDTFFQEQDQALGALPVGLGSTDDTTRFDVHLEGNLYLIPCHETWAELTVSYSNVKRTEQILSEGNPCGGTPKPEGVGKVSDLPSSGRWADIGCGVGVIREYEAEEVALTFLLEDQYHCEGLDFYGGVRFDFFSAEDNQTGRDDEKFLVGAAAGVTKHFTNRHTGYANVSLGWRRPSLAERTATAVVDGTVVFGNEDLTEELHGNLEFGWKSALMDRVSFNAAVFGHYVDDFIAPVPIATALGNEAELDNLGDVLMFGGELAAAWRPLTTMEGLELFGTMGITRSTSEKLVQNVPLLWRLGSRYSVPQPLGYRVRRWFAEASAYGATESFDGARGGGAYGTMDFLFGALIDRGDYRRVELNLGVQNVFDVDYTPPSAVLPAAGVGGFVGILFRF